MIDELAVVPTIYNWLKDNDLCRFNYLYGGAGSAKSWAVAEYLVFEKFLKEPGNGILALRKTKPEAKVSCLRVVREIIEFLVRIYDLKVQENKTDLFFKSNGGSHFWFDSVDDVMKKKSLEGVNYVWIEETTEFTAREFIQLNLRCRAKNLYGKNRLFCTFNPEDPVGNAWLKQLADEAGRKPDSQVLHVTHWDNPFLSADEHEQIESLANQDDEYDKIYRQGIWATPTNLIYNNWEVVDTILAAYDERAYGLDFGYSSSPAALIEVRFGGDEIHEQELLYETGLTNPQLIERLNLLIDNKSAMIVADAAEPKSIQEIKNAGFNIHPCLKGPDSVRNGISTVRAHRTFVLANSTNLRREKTGYKWKTDKDGNVLSEPVKFNDHLMDAERYVVQKVKGKTAAGLSFLSDNQKGFDTIEDEELAWAMAEDLR